MKLNGRITIYGEYLMHEDREGLIMPSSLFLQTESKGDNKSNYRKESDKVLSLVKDYNINPCLTINGNLPLGYGFAGSTILGFLHLSHLKNDIRKEKLIFDIDKKIHGFTPSGLDFNSCYYQGWGLYSNKSGWNPINQIPDIKYYTIILPKEKKIPLETIQKRILSKEVLLSEIQLELNKKVVNSSFLDLKLLKKYSEILLSLDVYTKASTKFISNMLDYGFTSKCIGGLYNKAIIIIKKEFSNKDKSFIHNMVSSLNGKIVSKI